MSEGNIPAGFYKGCRGVAGSGQFARTKGDDEQIALDVYVPELERAFTTFLYFSERGAPYAIERLRALGWDGEDVTDLTGIDQKDVNVQIKYEMYEGKERMKVEIATGGGRVTLDNPLNDGEKRAFAARMKQFLKGAGAAPAQRPAPRPRTQRPAGAEAPFASDTDHGDDIPF